METTRLFNRLRMNFRLMRRVGFITCLLLCSATTMAQPAPRTTHGERWFKDKVHAQSFHGDISSATITNATALFPSDEIEPILEYLDGRIDSVTASGGISVDRGGTNDSYIELSSQGTPEDPLPLVIQNPSFETGTMEGWINTAGIPVADIVYDGVYGVSANNGCSFYQDIAVSSDLWRHQFNLTYWNYRSGTGTYRSFNNITFYDSSGSVLSDAGVVEVGPSTIGVWQQEVRSATASINSATVRIYIAIENNPFQRDFTIDLIEVTTQLNGATSSNNFEFNTNVLVDTSNRAQTIIIPATPELYDTFSIIDKAGTFASHPVTLDAGGELIRGSTATVVLDVTNTVADFVYSGTEFGWIDSIYVGESSECAEPTTILIDSDLTEAQIGALYVADSSVSAMEINVPASPDFGDSFEVIDASGTFYTNPLTVNGNGARIRGSTESIELDIDWMYARFIYHDVAVGWLYHTGL